MPTESRISRKTLSIMIVIITVFIVVLYNLPGSRKPTAVETGPLILPDTEAQAVKNEHLNLTAPSLIAETEPKSHHIDIQSWTTPKGAQVLFVSAPEIPMLDVRLVFDAGAARDGDLPGLAALTNAMLDQGAGISSVDDIARLFEGLGAQINNRSYRDMAVVSLRTLSDAQYSDPALSLFYDVVADPTFATDSLDRLRAQMLLGLQQEKQSPSALGSKAYFQSLYGEHPYAIPPDGTAESLNTITRSDLRDFHKKYYVASNMVVAIIGAIDRTSAELIALQLDQRLHEGQPALNLPSPEPLQRAQQEHIEFPSSQTHITVGSLGIERGNPDWYALTLGNHILGAGGFSSRLNQVLRQDNGLVYNVYSQFAPMAATGPFLIGLQTRGDQADEALQLLNQTLGAFLEQGPTTEELVNAKRHILGSFPLQTASNSNLVDYLGMIGFYDLPLDFLQSYPQNIEKVELKDIKAAFQRTLDANKLLTVTVGQREE